MDRVGVSEDVVCCLPIGVLVGIAEARHPERRSIGERSTKVGRSGACADRRVERVKDPDRIITKQLSGERRVIGPAVGAAAGSKQLRQFAGCFVAQRNEINRLTPGGRFLGTLRRHHLTDNRRQHSHRVFPAKATTLVG